MEVLEHVRSTIKRYHLLTRGDVVVVGVSGGPDSLCLLHLLFRLRDEYALSLHVAHLNHCLRGAEADADAAFVAQLATEWGLPVTVEKRDVAALAKERKLAIEEAARQVRYAFLASVARQIGACKIAVGHNADDQVETVCMHWLRGSGLAGLRGMQPVSRLDELRLKGERVPAGEKEGDLLLIRPLLEVPRAEIEAYCAAHGLRPRFDRSNFDTTYYRNRLRHELLPFLETFNPRIREVILRSADIISADYAYLRQQALKAWTEVTLAENEQAITFDLEKWRLLPLSLQRSVLREAIHRLRKSLRNINWVHIDQAISVLQTGCTGMAATLPSGLEARLRYDTFIVADATYAEPLPDIPLLHGVKVPLHIPGQTPLPDSDWYLVADIIGRCELRAKTLHQAQPWQAYLDYDVTGDELYLRPRRTGDRFWPQGLGDKPTTVHNFMINAKVPRAWRDSIPLLVSPHQVLWVAGWRIDERAKVTEATTRVLALEFRKQGYLRAGAISDEVPDMCAHNASSKACPVGG
nr:tRNA lysidine(34) synthetase TilS [Chloroflexota bacterium]